jgi:hypothetical protein
MSMYEFNLTEEDYNLIQAVLQKTLTFETGHKIIFNLAEQYEKQKEDVKLQSSQSNGLRVGLPEA